MNQQPKLQTITQEEAEKNASFNEASNTKNRVYNKYLSINWKPLKEILTWILIFTAVWLLYQFTYKVKYGDLLANFKLFDVPYEIKCFFEEPGCEDGNINGWSLVQIFAYLIIGYFVPNQYLVIVVISVLIELIEPMAGYQPKYIIDPVTNLTGYTLGSLMSPKNNKNLDYFAGKYGMY
jgi:hypothetical protein